MSITKNKKYEKPKIMKTTKLQGKDYVDELFKFVEEVKKTQYSLKELFSNKEKAKRINNELFKVLMEIRSIRTNFLKFLKTDFFSLNIEAKKKIVSLIPCLGSETAIIALQDIKNEKNKEIQEEAKKLIGELAKNVPETNRITSLMEKYIKKE